MCCKRRPCPSNLIFCLVFRCVCTASGGADRSDQLTQRSILNMFVLVSQSKLGQAEVCYCYIASRSFPGSCFSSRQQHRLTCRGTAWTITWGGLEVAYMIFNPKKMFMGGGHFHQHIQHNCKVVLSIMQISPVNFL